MSILGEAVQYILGCGTICHRWWYGKHTKLSPIVIAINPTTHRAVVILKIQICQRSLNILQYKTKTTALRLKMRIMLYVSVQATLIHR